MNRAFATLIVLLLAAFQIASAQTRPNPRDGYMGDDACRSCHALQVDSFHKTAHFLTSSEPNQHSILGKFTSGGFFQTANSRTERFAFVIGSGDKGQTYLFCHMPRQETSLIVFNSVGKQLRPQIRNHWITVYSAPLSNKDTPKIP